VNKDHEGGYKELAINLQTAIAKMRLK